jgi:hypothetical protein
MTRPVAAASRASSAARPRIRLRRPEWCDERRIGDEAGRQVGRGHGDEIEIRMLGRQQPCGRNQYETRDAAGLSQDELRREQAAERRADEVKTLQAKQLEEPRVVHDEVVDRGYVRIVGGFAVAGVIRQDDAELVQPVARPFEAVPAATAMKIQHRRPLPRAVDDRAHAVDDVFVASETFRAVRTRHTCHRCAAQTGIGRPSTSVLR